MSIEAGVSRLRAIGTKAGVTVLAPAKADPDEIAYTLVDLVDLMISPPDQKLGRNERRERVLQILDRVIEDEDGRKDRLYG
jgi:hypothetical protein